MCVMISYRTSFWASVHSLHSLAIFDIISWGFIAVESNTTQHNTRPYQKSTRNADGEARPAGAIEIKREREGGREGGRGKLRRR